MNYSKFLFQHTVMRNVETILIVKEVNVNVRMDGRKKGVSTSPVIPDAHSMAHVSRASATVIKDGKENIAL